jgi:predicted ribosomally synthesized peptide with nif11-like leader
MSLQRAIDFTTAAVKDPALAAEIAKDTNGKSPEKSAEAFVAVGKAKGYDFTSEEATQVRLGITQATAKLSEEELDQVAGGFGAQDAANLGIQLGVSRAVGVPIVGGIIGGGVAGSFDSMIHGGSASDIGNAFVSGMQNSAESTWNTTKSVVNTIFSGW